MDQGANLLPCVIEHDCTTHRDSGFILHEIVECLFVVMTPLMEKWACMEQHCGELFEWQWWEFGILFTNKIFVEPVTRTYNEWWAPSRKIETYACSTWKHIRSSDASSSSGRLRIKRLFLEDWYHLEGRTWVASSTLKGLQGLLRGLHVCRRSDLDYLRHWRLRFRAMMRMKRSWLKRKRELWAEMPLYSKYYTSTKNLMNIIM